MGFQEVYSQKFYPSSEELWAEMLVDIIRTAAEEHEECMKSLDDVKAQKQTKYIGVGKVSKPKSQNVIPSTVSAFQTGKLHKEIQLNTREGPIEEIQKSFQLSPRTLRKESHMTPAQPESTVCWKCGEAGHKKKDCMAILFCTNCSRNNHTTRKCRQVFKENCMCCK